MTRADHIRMARVYLAEAQRTCHRQWAFVLLAWAAARRRLAATSTHQMQLILGE